MRPLSPAAAAAITTDLRPRQQAVPAIPEKFQGTVGERQRVLAVATAEALVGSEQGGKSGKGGGGNAGKDAKGKAGDGDSNGDSIIPVGDTVDGARVGKGNGSDDGGGNGKGGGNNSSNGGGNSGGNNSGNGGGNGSGGRGLGSGVGGGNGSSLGSGGSAVGSGFASVRPPRHFKKQN
jgi:hypothetical protein